MRKMLKREGSSEYTTKEYWNSVCKHTRVEICNDAITQLLSDYLPKVSKDDKKTCFEIGCCPGGYLAFLSKRMGYIANGIDFSDDVPFMEKQLRRKQYNVGEIINGDFFAYVNSKQHSMYDLVCSFGFVEHFSNYLEVFDMHDSLLKSGGYMVITAPNYYIKSMNYFLMNFLDKKNLSIHNVESMDTNLWKHHMQDLGYDVIFCGAFGGIGNCWGPDNLKGFRGGVAEELKYIQQVLNTTCNLSDHMFFSKYCGLVAVKR